MESMEKEMTGEESLRIITEMINKTKVNISQGSFHLLFWGWLIFLCSFAEYLLLNFTDLANPWYVWMLTIPGVFISLGYGFIKGSKAKVHTYADMVYMWTWMGFLAAAIVLFIVNSGNMRNIGTYILLLAGLPTFISGFIIKFKPLIVGGASFWIFSLIAHFAGQSVTSLIIAAAVLTGYLVPGYLLKRKVDHETI